VRHCLGSTAKFLALRKSALLREFYVLGLFGNWDCSLEERQLFSGDTLLLYTDGATESFNDAGEEFGERRLIEALCRHRGQCSQDLIASIVEEVRQFNCNEQQDDITLIAAQCRENAA